MPSTHPHIRRRAGRALAARGRLRWRLIDARRGHELDDHDQPLGRRRYASNGTPGVRLLHALARRANFPDPTGDEGIPKSAVISALKEVSNSQFEAAGNACKHPLPSGGSLSGRDSQTVTAQQQQYYLKAAACMRSHGITNFPDPSFSRGQVEFPMLEHLVDIHSTQFTQAYQTCQKLIPPGLPDSRSGG